MQRLLGQDHVQHAETPIVPLSAPRAAIPHATRFRSTWVVSALEGLRQAGHFERYAELVGPHGDQLLTCVAGIWLPMEVAHAHYRTCEQLGISDQAYLDMVQAGAQVRRAWHAAVIASTERADTPWSVLPSVTRIWTRTVEGGAVALFQLAPARARVEYVSCSLLDIPYFRRAMRVMLQLLFARACPGLVVQDLAERDAGSCSYLVTWPG